MTDIKKAHKAVEDLSILVLKTLNKEGQLNTSDIGMILNLPRRKGRPSSGFAGFNDALTIGILLHLHEGCLVKKMKGGWKITTAGQRRLGSKTLKV